MKGGGHEQLNCVLGLVPVFESQASAHWGFLSPSSFASQQPQWELDPVFCLNWFLMTERERWTPSLIRDTGADLRAVNPPLKGMCQAFESNSLFFFQPPPFKDASQSWRHLSINNSNTSAVVWIFVFSEYLEPSNQPASLLTSWESNMTSRKAVKPGTGGIKCIKCTTAEPSTGWVTKYLATEALKIAVPSCLPSWKAWHCILNNRVLQTVVIQSPAKAVTRILLQMF